MKKIILLVILPFILIFPAYAQQVVNPSSSNETSKPMFGKLLSNVTVSKSSFNPSLGEDIAVSYALSKPAKVILEIYDSDKGLIRKIESDSQKILWNGKDEDGQIIPDEAYFFTITAKDAQGNEEVYDPTTFSGGEEHDITTADIDSQNHTISYKMPEMGRVMIRMGIQGGPLMNQLIDWKPRVKGLITEYWNGKDKDNLIDILSHPRFKMIVVYFAFPENSIISFGNKSIGYIEYKKKIASKRLLKPQRNRTETKLSRHYLLPRLADYEPTLKMVLSNVQETDKDGIPILKGKTLVKVELDEADKIFFQNTQFEICFFLDQEFYAEDETGYTPFNWVWDLSNVKDGEHVLTVNISSFKDQIGLLSRKVKVVR